MSGAVGESQRSRVGIAPEQPLPFTQHNRVKQDRVDVDQILGHERLDEHAAAQDGDDTVPLFLQPPDTVNDVAVENMGVAQSRSPRCRVLDAT